MVMVHGHILAGVRGLYCTDRPQTVNEAQARLREGRNYCLRRVVMLPRLSLEVK